jgi:hypothetical protein
MLDIDVARAIEEPFRFGCAVTADHKLIAELDDEAEAEIKDDVALVGRRPIPVAAIAAATSVTIVAAAAITIIAAVIATPIFLASVATITTPTVVAAAGILGVAVRLATGKLLAELLTQAADVLNRLLVALRLELGFDGRIRRRLGRRLGFRLSRLLGRRRLRLRLLGRDLTFRRWRLTGGGLGLRLPGGRHLRHGRLTCGRRRR